MQWYYNEGSERRGPVSHEELQSLISQGRVGPDNLAWREGMANWVRAGDLPELAPLFSPPSETSSPQIPQPPPAPHSQPRPQSNTFGSHAPGSAQPQGGANIYGSRQQNFSYSPVPDNNEMAIASVALGILALCCCGLFTGIPAVVCGHIARNQIADSNGAQTGGGLALAGLILGYISIIGSVIYALLFFGGFVQPPVGFE